ncbi:TetR/AcrR family transcriptional regulator [Marimonas lutisalis]|uniref:TetR/AcrR family transcriptional regulator n=1 Tax=Marimonas lutisalis TaxID=2545756 RepID=UPI001375C5F4|nr:TetR/AcrR family transcriptional regulator [Marimonas lutisalis]
MRKGERTRLNLLVAGAGFLAENNLDALTVSAICGHAGVAHGTFYLYFQDRNDVAGALLSKFVDYLQVQMRISARQAGDPVRNTTAAYFELFKANAGLMKCLVVGIDAFPEARTAFQRLNNEWARTVVRAYVKNHRGGGLSEDELMRRAYALGGMVDQYLTALFVTEDPWIASLSKDMDAVIDTLTTLWRKGMHE